MFLSLVRLVNFWRDFGVMRCLLIIFSDTLGVMVLLHGQEMG